MDAPTSPKLVSARLRIAVATWSAILVISIAVLLCLTAYAGSFEAVGRLARGQRVFPVRSLVELGNTSSAAMIRAEYILKNFTFEDVNIIGSQASCSCTLLEGQLPLGIAAGGSVPVAVVVNAPVQPGGFRNSIELITDSHECPRIVLSMKGVVTKRVDRRQTGPQ
jgi:hypothetical protein